MIKNTNISPDKFDELLRSSLENYQPDVSSHIWGKLSTKIFKKNVADFVTFRQFKNSFRPEFKAAGAHIKIWLSYAAAACLTVGVVFGSAYIITDVINKGKDVQQKETGIQTTMPGNNQNMDIVTDENPQIIENNTSEKLDNNRITTVSSIDNRQENLVNNNTNLPALKDNTSGTSVKTDTVKTNKTNYQTSLQQYIEKVNSPDKPVEHNPVSADEEVIPDINFDELDELAIEEIDAEVYSLEIPNVFTPNNDGYNDYFVIKNIDKYPENTLIVASRSGNTVLETSNYQNNWDARNQPAGTYYYILSYKDKRNNHGVIKGIVSVVR